MTLCDDCRNIRLAKHIKGMQKLDKRVLMRQNRRLNERFSYGSPEYRSDLGKEARAALEWKAWSMNARESVRRDVKSSIICRTSKDTFDMSFPLVLANLGSRLQHRPIRNCAFCRLLSNIRIPARNHVPGSNADVLVAFRYFRRPDVHHRWHYDGTTSDVVMIVVLSGEQWATESREVFEFPMEDHRPIGFLTCRLKDCESDVWRFVPETRSTINFDEIQRAIVNCRQNHRACRAKKTASPEPIKISLIDCYSRKLIQATSLKRYVALSYVWGGVAAGDLDSTTLPRTLEDAMRVTKALGFRYIWIDKYCVDQNNHATKDQQLRTMGRVYEDAMVTLVAASGDDANAGLPGAPGHRRKRVRRPFLIDDCMISQEAAPIDLEIQNSVWASRAWTFQEQLFSRNFVVFTPEQVSFECRVTKYSSRFGMHDSETETTLAKPLPVWDTLYSRLIERTDRYFPRTREKYQYLVEEYWPRRLTFPSDGINAFAGALEHLKALWNAELFEDAKDLGSHESRMTFTAGIPHLLDTAGMPLLLEYKEESPDQGLRLFVQGLTWYSRDPSKRRKDFPSWCWAGWTPALEAQQSSLAWHDEEGHSWPLIQEVFFKSSPDIDTSGTTKQEENAPEPVPIAEYESSSVPQAVIFNAPIVPPSVISWWLGENEPTLWGCKASWFLADKSLSHETDFLGNLHAGIYCLITLKHEERTHVRAIVFLLVRRASHDRHERIGLVVMEMNINRQPRWYMDLERRTWELI